MLIQDEEVVEIYSGEVCNSFFVHYDDTGQVYLLSTHRDDTLNNLEIKIELIQKFLEGKKSCRNYNIEYFIGIKDGTILDTDELVTSVSSELALFNIPITDCDTGIIFEHSVYKKSWVVTCSGMLKDKLSALPVIPFYICKKNNPYFLYTTHLLDPAQLVHGPLEIKFTTQIEESLSKISVMTLTKFITYSIRETHE